MKQCPTCKKEWPDEFSYCKVDGHALILLEQDQLIGTVFDDKYKILKK